jgi:Mitochondrial K+-H+ exchange-related
MTLFFVRDSKNRYRCFMAEPAVPPSVHRSWARRALEVAKDKLMLLPQRILRQEQAFGKAVKETTGPLRVVHSGLLDQVHIRRKFRLFLHKQRSSHLLLIIGEAVLLPFAALSGLLPGPNVAFYSLALIMILQWRAWRGLRRILHLEWEFQPDKLFAEWEEAVEAGRREDFPTLLARVEQIHGINKVSKILLRKSK